MLQCSIACTTPTTSRGKSRGSSLDIWSLSHLSTNAAMLPWLFTVFSSSLLSEVDLFPFSTSRACFKKSNSMLSLRWARPAVRSSVDPTSGTLAGREVGRSHGFALPLRSFPEPARETPPPPSLPSASPPTANVVVVVVVVATPVSGSTTVVVIVEVAPVIGTRPKTVVSASFRASVRHGKYDGTRAATSTFETRSHPRIAAWSNWSESKTSLLAAGP